MCPDFAERRRQNVLSVSFLRRPLTNRPRRCIRDNMADCRFCVVDLNPTRQIPLARRKSRWLTARAHVKRHARNLNAAPSLSPFAQFRERS